MIHHWAKRRLVIYFFSYMATILFLCSCTKVAEIVNSKGPYFTEGYKTALDKWSREARIHRGLEVKLIATATYKSHEFRMAYAEEFAEAYRLSEKEKKRLVQDQSSVASENNEFILATYVPEKKWDEFDKARSMWKLYLVDAHNVRTAPVEIRRLKSKDAVSTHFFPYITPWKSVYAVSFPAFSHEHEDTVEKKVPTFRLVITSVVGTTEMVWGVNQEKSL